MLLEGKQRPVIIMDEAQHLRNEVLEDLRLLTNYEMDSENWLCLLFVGLTELRRRLKMSVHESLDQRIVIRYHLSGLARDELSEYLTHRLRIAGCELPLFEPASVEAIYQTTQALPRNVNRLAYYALTAAAIAKRKTQNGYSGACAGGPVRDRLMNGRLMIIMNNTGARAVVGSL